MNGEGRAIIHYRDRLGRCSRTQFCKQFRNVGPEFVELDQHRIIRHVSGRQLNWVAGFQQQTRFGLLIALFEYRHRGNETTVERNSQSRSGTDFSL